MFAGALFPVSGPSAISSLSPIASSLGHAASTAGDILLDHTATLFAQAHLGLGDAVAGLTFERCTASGALVAFWGRLDDIEGLARRYRLGADDVRGRSPAGWALEAWRRAGTAAPAELEGDFAFAVVEPGARRVFLARDAFGTRPLYYRRHGTTILFATGLAALQRMSSEPAAADPTWMGLYLAGVSSSDAATAFEGVLKVRPGHGVLLDGADAPRELRWLAWRDDAPWAERRDERWVEAYRERLVDAVRARLSNARPVGIESSGGLDSASIVGTAAGLVADPGSQILCLGLAHAEGEGSAIVGVSRAHGIRHTWIDASRRVLATDAAIDEVLRALGQPQQAPTTSGLGGLHDECMRHGARVLLSGFGGDEAASHWGAAVRHELRDRRAWRALFEVTPGQGALRVARALRDCLRGTRDRPPGAIDPAQQASQRLLRPELADGLGLAQRRRAMASAMLGHRRANDAVLGALGHPQLSCRLEEATLLARARGIEMAWPLLDARLVQQVLSTPAIERFGPRGVPRYLHRRAVAPVVPPEVAARANKDLGYLALRDELAGGRFRAALLAVAREVDGDLHPSVAALVDRARLRALIDALAAGALATPAVGAFRRNLARLRWLDRWRKLGPGAE